MAGYTRQRPLDIINGAVIDADDHAAEFDQLELAFDSTVGHKHDGTIAGGPAITKVGPAQDLIVNAVAVAPKTTATLDLGTTAVRFKDAYFSGALNITGGIPQATIVNLTTDLAGKLPIGANAVSASKWATARTITLAGDATGSTSIDGSGNVILTVAVGDDSHNHIIANVDGLQVALNAKLGSTANAVSASKWLTPRTITLGGDATGVTTIDGSGNVVLTVAVVDDSHNHIIGNVDGLQVALDGKLGSGANAVSASKWLTARTITLNGDVSGATSIDGSGNVTLTTTVGNNSHLHDAGNINTGVFADARIPANLAFDILTVNTGLLSGTATNTPGIGSANNGVAINPVAYIASSRTDNPCAYFNRNFTDGISVLLSKGGNAVGSISVTAAAASFNTTSDYRLKENITPIDDAVARVMAYKPKRFNFKTTPDQTVSGFIAHELAQVAPTAVLGAKDGVDEEGNPVYQGVDLTKEIIADLTAALQIALKRIEALENK